jgi:hypothetical protein
MINPEKYIMKKIMTSSRILTLEDYTNMIEVIQKDAYNEGIKDAIENVVTKQVQVDYEGVRAGGFYTKTIIDKDSIIKLKK